MIAHAMPVLVGSSRPVKPLTGEPPNPFYFATPSIDIVVKDIQLVANDLKVYYNGFEVSLGKGNIDDAVEYLRKMRTELDDNLDYLLSKKEGTAAQDAMKMNLDESQE